jgi:hypothetical protein
MSTDDLNARRVIFSAGNFLGVNVMSIPRDEWHEMVNLDGSPTRLQKAPTPLKEVERQAMVVAITASGVNNCSPGIDVLRLDAKDAPYIYNKDHYTAVETITLHSGYPTFLQHAGVTDTDELRDELNKKVYVIKNDPSEFDDHWCLEVPDQVRNAKPKEHGGQAHE